MRAHRRPVAWFAALLALLVGIASLPSAGAAESASVRVGPDGAREFAGADRYETAVLLAQAVVDARTVSSAIVASGESLVVAAAAASLAAAQGSVVLLTRPDELPASVAEFIQTAGLSEITIVGGSAAVVPPVELQLAALDGVTTVSRVAGADRYATSAAIAAGSAVPGSFCGIERSVFVVNGSSLVDAVVAGPYAYALDMPILLTASDGLSPAVAQYLREANIQRAVVLGDLKDVSSVVDGQLVEAGVAHPWRMQGPDASTRAITLLEAVATCDETTIASDIVALVNATVSVDATTAAAALGTGLGAPNTVIPLIAVTEPLPDALIRYLAPNQSEGKDPRYQHLDILPLGNSGRLSPQLLQSIISIAAPPPPPTVTFFQYSHYPPVAHLGSCVQQSNVYLARFSTPVLGIDAADPRNYMVDGRPVNWGRVVQVSSTDYALIGIGHRYPPSDATSNTWTHVAPPHSAEMVSLGIRRNGVRTTDGRSVPHHVVSTLSRRHEIVAPEQPLILAVAPPDGDEIEILVVGGPNERYDYSEGATNEGHLDVSEVEVKIGDKAVALTDTDYFRRGTGVGYSCRESDGSARFSYRISSNQESRLKPGDTVIVAAGSVANTLGTSPEKLTVPIIFESNRAHPTHFDPITVGGRQRFPWALPPIDVRLRPYFNYPPLRNVVSSQCINPQTSYVASFSRAVHVADATTQSSYELHRDGAILPALESTEVAISVRGDRHTGGPVAERISATEFRLSIDLQEDDALAIRPFTIRTLYWNHVDPQVVAATLHKPPAFDLMEPTFGAVASPDGRRLTLFWAGAWRRYSVTPTWNRGEDNRPADDADMDQLEFASPNFYYVGGCADTERNGSETRRVPSDSSVRIRPGDEIVLEAGQFWYPNGEQSPETRVKVESMEELQAAARAEQLAAQ